MSHDATKVLLGTTRSNIKEVINKKGTLEAGLIVRLKSDGTISKAAADGSPIGISLGKDMSDAGRTAIAIEGNEVPVLLTDGFTPTIGSQVAIDDVTGMAKAAGTGVTGMNATYLTGELTGVAEDGTEKRAALISMPGGL